MQYPKKIMKQKELIALGYPKSYLVAIYRNRNQKIAWKIGKGGRTSTILYDTEELEKYRIKQCTGV